MAKVLVYPLVILLILGCGTPSLVPSSAQPAPSLSASPALASTSAALSASTAPSASIAPLAEAPAERPVPTLPPEPWPFQEAVPGMERMASSLATKYGSIGPNQCAVEARKRKLPIKYVRGQKGISSSVRIVGPFHGVRFDAPGEGHVNGILDCRLALALDDFAAVMARHEVVQIHGEFYRANARVAGTRKLSQHAFGLAIDFSSVQLRDRSALYIERDWHGEVGGAPCGPDAHPVEPTKETLALRNLICEVAREGIFHFMLTPGYNLAHRNHFHFDIQRKSPGMAIR